MLLVGGGYDGRNRLRTQNEANLDGIRCCTFEQHLGACRHPVTPAEAEKIKATLEAFGCTGGKMEKETEGSGYFEVDDANCNWGGQYDIKLDKEIKLIVMSRD